MPRRLADDIMEMPHLSVRHAKNIVPQRAQMVAAWLTALASMALAFSRTLEATMAQGQRESNTQSAAGASSRTPSSTMQSSSRHDAGAFDVARASGKEEGTITEHERGPGALMRRMMEDMDRMFDTWGFGTPFSPFSSIGLGRLVPTIGRRLWLPQIEVREREGKLVVKADLPGLTKDDVHIELREGALTLRGERRHEQEEEREGRKYSERSYGSFTRTIPVPQGVSAEHVDAAFENGVLTISLALPEGKQARTVPIREGSSSTEGDFNPSSSGDIGRA
jgi:HSP20 family protein